MTLDPTNLRERIRALPGMDRLLPALEGLPPVYLVGGMVRDLLLEDPRPSLDFDIAVEGDARAAARTLAERLSGRYVEHDRFETATVLFDDGRRHVDLAQTRTERYPLPGELPIVKPASLEEDLHRRDFTINAMAAALKGDELGRLHDPEDGRRDLELGLVRVLHDQSFLDDPTRLFRAVRYAARFDYRMDIHTDDLARDAIKVGALTTVSGHRVREELLAILEEDEAPTALKSMNQIGLDTAVHESFEPDTELVAAAALGAIETGADRVWAMLAAIVSHDPPQLVPWLDTYLGLRADERNRVAKAARDAPALAEGLKAVELSPSAIHALLHDEPPEALALALAMHAPARPIMEWSTNLRHVRLEINGDDLIAAGVEPGPELGRALAETLRAKLDGEVNGHDDELKYALKVIW